MPIYDKAKREIFFSCRVVINSGAALLLFLPALYVLYFGALISPVLERLFLPAASALTGAFAGFLVRRTASDKTETAANIERLKLGAGAESKLGESDAK